MAESNPPEGRTAPLAGLTAVQADERIEKYGKVVQRAKDDYEAKRDHLKDMKAARKDLAAPEPAGNGTRAQAQAAELRSTGGGER